MDKHNFKHSKDIGMTEEVGKYKKKAKKRKLSRSKHKHTYIYVWLTGWSKYGPEIAEVCTECGKIYNVWRVGYCDKIPNEEQNVVDLPHYQAECYWGKFAKRIEQ